MEEQLKEPKEMSNWMELFLDLIKTKIIIRNLEHDLDPFVLDEYWRNSPYPEDKDSSVQKMRKEYKLYQTRFSDLQGELNQREQQMIEAYNKIKLLYP